MTQKKELSEKVTALFNMKVGNISAELAEPGRKFFCHDNRLMDDDEDADLSGEFMSLIVALLASKDPTSQASPQFHALQMFFTNLSQKIQVRGGHVEEVVRYTHQLQQTLVEALEKDSGITFTQ